jgi:hypothetical protein
VCLLRGTSSVFVHKSDQSSYFKDLHSPLSEPQCQAAVQPVTLRYAGFVCQQPTAPHQFVQTRHCDTQHSLLATHNVHYTSTQQHSTVIHFNNHNYNFTADSFLIMRSSLHILVYATTLTVSYICIHVIATLPIQKHTLLAVQ